MPRHDFSAEEVAGAFSAYGGHGWVVVLTTEPERGLKDEEIDSVAYFFGCDRNPIRRIGPASAEMASLMRPGDGSTDSIAMLPGVDINVVPNTARRKRLLVADMDSTIIGCECIDELAKMAGVGPEVTMVTRRAMAGEIGFDEALHTRVALLEGAKAELIDRVWDEKVRLNPGAEALIRRMVAEGAHTMLVSGGFTVFTERVAALCGFHEHRANVLEIADGRLTGRIVPPLLGREAKREALLAAMKARELKPDEVVAIGDGANDLGMIEAAGLGVAFRAKPVLAAAANARIDYAGLEGVLALQGLA